MITRLLLRNRLAWLLTIGLVTAFMAYQGTSVEMDYGFAKLMPDSDSVSLEYDQLVEEFGQVSNTIVIAMEDPDFFKRDHLEQWTGLMSDLRKIDGVEFVQSLTEAYGLVVDSVTEKLAPDTLFKALPANGEEEIALEARVKSWPFYKGGLYQGDTYMAVVRIDEARLYNKQIVPIV